MNEKQNPEIIFMTEHRPAILFVNKGLIKFRNDIPSNVCNLKFFTQFHHTTQYRQRIHSIFARFAVSFRSNPHVHTAGIRVVHKARLFSSTER